MSDGNKNNLIKPSKNWIFLITMRIVLNLFSQRSYIHPDEFFQGLEIISGDLFNCSKSIHRAWEFELKKDQEPIRNMAIPYLVYGTPLLILKYVSSIGAVKDYTRNPHGLTDLNLISVQSNTLIYYPRLLMTFLSVLIDLCLLKLAKLCDLDQSSVLITFASSYITNVYLTRTFSNSIETILFCVLVYLILKSIKSQYILNDKFLVESIDKKSNLKNVISSSTNEFKLNNFGFKKNLNQTSSIKRIKFFDIYKYNYLGDLIGLVLCIGVFNRPTFLIYSFIPILYWVLNGLDNCNTIKQFVNYVFKRGLSLTRYFIPASIMFVIFDTIYFYKTDSLNELIYHLKNFRVLITPFNFFLYNSNPNNLKEHGEHPFYNHFLNCFLLFGVQHLILFLISFQFFKDILNSVRLEKFEDQKSKFKLFKQKLTFVFSHLINNLFCFLIFSFLVPLIIFSMVSHKEPRFLLPLLIPICLLTSHCLFGSQSQSVLKIIWVCFNFVSLVVYGYFHQGGVLSSLNHIQKMFTHVSNLELDQHVIFYHTYMPPRYLVMAPVSVNLINNKRYLFEMEKSKSLNRNEPVRRIYDLMSSGNSTQIEVLVNEIKKNSTKKDYAIFLVAPAITEFDFNKNEDCFMTMNQNKSKTQLSFHLISKFRFHITFEHLKEHFDFLKCKFQIENKDSLICELNKCKKMSFFDRFLNSFSLNFYQIIL